MSIYERDPSDPLYGLAARGDMFEEVLEVVRSVLIAGPTWKYYRLDVLKSFEMERRDQYVVLAYVEDVIESERAALSGAVARGVTRYWTRWATFPEVKEHSAHAALEEAMRLLSDRVR